MQAEIQKDIGEEIIMKLKEIEFKLNKLLKKKNEEELQDPFMVRDRA